MNHFTIGQLAQLSNNTVVSIRYYGKYGLLGEIQQSPGGFRRYPESLSARFLFIENAKAVDVDLKDIKTLLTLQINSKPSHHIKKKTLAKIASIDDKIQTLNIMRDALSKWAQACDGNTAIDPCPILANLYKQHNQDQG